MAKEQQDWIDWFRYASASDIGMRRGNNQDSYAIHLATDAEQWRRQGHLFLVADGMGAHAAGELASKLAADHIPLLYQKQNEASSPQGLEKAILGANQEIHRRGQENIDFHNMGTTCSALLLLPQGAVVGHVGDSRVYRLRNGILSQLTFDHSLVWEMQQGNGKALDDSDVSLAGIPKNVITRSLGPHASITVDLEGPFPVEESDTFLLCSDGLTGPLSDEEIATIVGVLEPNAAAQLLVDLANMHGGPDNITVIICKITGRGMTTDSQSEKQITTRGDQRTQRDIHPIVWGTVCLLTLAGATLLATDLILPAIIAFVVAAICGSVALAVKRNLFRNADATLANDEQLGKGPYREISQLKARTFCEQLAEKLKAAQATVDARDWNIDWNEFRQHSQAAEDMLASNRETDAIGSYAKAIHLMVSQARENLNS